MAIRLFNRRKALRATAAAPLAGILGVGAQRAYPPPTPSAFDVAGAPIEPRVPPFEKLIEPATLPRYYESVREASRAEEFFASRRSLQSGAISPNIMALRSVSPQHKLIMHMRERDRIRDEQRTFIERAMDAFGVRDYFAKREQLHGSAPSAGSNY